MLTILIQADIGVREGKIVGIGKAGNPDVMDGVHPDLVVGASTEVIAGEKLIITAGAVDAHCHYICPQQWQEVCTLILASFIRSMKLMNKPGCGRHWPLVPLP